MVVAVANCYPHAAFTREQYQAVEQMNLDLNGWDVPSVNLLGAVDDGEGHWTRGFFHDEGHPNAGGGAPGRCPSRSSPPSSTR